MKVVKAMFVIVTVLLGTMVSSSALAWHGGPRVHFGVAVGGPLWWGPGYYPPYYYPPYYPPVVVMPPSSPPTYVEQGSDVQATPRPSQSSWYYCAESKAYYPYVKECPGEWQRVAPQPPPG